MNINLSDVNLLLGKFDDREFYLGALEQFTIFKNSSLELEYKINEGTGSTLTDSAGDNNGTINGATLVNNPILDIETSTDGGSTWDTATNGGSIPNIAGADTLDVRQVLETNDTTITPVLESLTVDIDTGDTNTDSGSFTATLDKDFKLSEVDTVNMTSTETEEGIVVKPQNDSGYFNKDAENYYTMVLEVFEEGSLDSQLVGYNHEGWFTDIQEESNWIDKEKETDTWTKISRGGEEWQKD